MSPNAPPLLFQPLDLARTRLLGLLQPWSGWMAAHRAERVAVGGVLAAITALILVRIAPLAMLTWGPLLLGTAHLLADIRYLIVRPGLHRRTTLRLLAIPALLIALASGWLPTLLPWSTGALLLAAALGARTDMWRRVGGIALAVGGALLLQAFGRDGALFLAHLHNVVALGLWWYWRPRSRVAWAVPVAVLAGAGLILVGTLDTSLRTILTDDFAQTDLWAGRLLTGIDRFETYRGLLLFAYLQSLHYSVWLRLLPDDDRPRPTPRTYAASWRALLADFGRAPLLLAVAIAGLIILWGLFSPAAAVTGYLRLAAFHGPLEYAVLLLWWLEGRRI